MYQDAVEECSLRATSPHECVIHCERPPTSPDTRDFDFEAGGLKHRDGLSFRSGINQGRAFDESYIDVRMDHHVFPSRDS